MVTIDKTKMIQFILRCHRTAPLCVIWYWHSETLRLNAPATKHVRKEVKADQQDQLSCKSFFRILLHKIAAEQINKSFLEYRKTMKGIVLCEQSQNN